MQGKFFVEVVQGSIAIQGLVEGAAGPGFWACRLFGGAVQTTQVVAASNMQNLVFFDNANDMQAWLALNVKGQDSTEMPPAPDPDEPQDPETLDDIDLKTVRLGSDTESA